MPSRSASKALFSSALLVFCAFIARPAFGDFISASAADSKTSVPENQKGGSTHIGEGLPAESAFDTYAAPGSGRLLLQNAPAAPPAKSLQCKVNTLRKLGWTVDSTLAPHVKPTLSTYGACYATTLPELQSQHYLRLSLPANTHAAADLQMATEAVDQALTSSGTVCAYETFVAPAVARATQKLFSNHSYAFANIFGSGSVRMGNLPTLWQQVPCKDDDKCYQPMTTPSSSLQALYTASFASECGTGLQLAEYEMINELFGAKELDARFDKSELYVGDWPSITPSASVIHGQSGRRFTSQTGMDYALPGPQMFVGVSGYLGNVLGDEYLDTPVDRGENMLIVRTSAAAAQAFAKNGGLTYYNQAAHKIWELAQQGSGSDLTQWAMDRTTNSTQGEPQLMALLRDPFFHDTVVYVHDIGYRNISQHLLRLVGLNPRTPYSIRFYSESTHGEIFDRWLKMQLDQCDQ